MFPRHVARRGLVTSRASANLPRGIVSVVAILTLASSASARSKKDHPAIHGRVAMADGSLPQLLITIERICSGAARRIAYADSQGRFTADLGEDPGACAVRVALPGYRSSTLTSDGTLILRWRGRNELTARSGQYKLMYKNARQDYETALDLAAKGKIHDAEDALEQSTKTFPWAAPHYLALGVLQEREGNAVAAEKSYRTAMTFEDGFLPVYAYACALEISRQEWQAALDHSKKILALEPGAFPAAWYASALALLNLHDIPGAEKSAREGIAIDSDHEYPELEYVLALALADKGDRSGAMEHLTAYLKLDPNGKIAQAAREQLAELGAGK